MHRLIKIRVIRDFDRLEEHMRGCLGNLFDIHKTAAFFLPHADFYETTQGLVLRLDLAGVAAEDVSLSLAGHELVIRGRRRPPPPEGLRRFMHLEIPFGAFERRFMLPIAIDPQGVEARYVDGILEVQLPRRAAQSRQIPVKPAAE
ncbi:MAG: Hsp20/alpha crystallin family protein [Syntrophobacterales bacterium]|jgi:HSP20 family protein|nr:Hsp20/alpha crystallin family protein [Syntrophobacterales bacterium]